MISGLEIKFCDGRHKSDGLILVLKAFFAWLPSI
jgi:hypothetical protein